MITKEKVEKPILTIHDPELGKIDFYPEGTMEQEQAEKELEQRIKDLSELESGSY